MTSGGDPLSARDRLLAATYACVARYGLGKTTIEDVVKESGVSRASIYRHFPGGRDELVRETVGWEIAHFLTRLGDHVRDEPDLTMLVAEGLRFARRSMLSHELLQKILETEPERLLGLLTTESARTVPFIAAFLYPYLERERASGRLQAGVDVARAADYLARMILSLIGSPGRWDFEAPEMLEELVRRELLGGIVA